jgi:hypothetical protein
MGRGLLLFCLLVSCSRSEPGSSGDSASVGPGAHAPASAQASNTDSIFVDRGACPFECCTYGRWRADSAVALRAAPDSNAQIVGTVSAGTTVDAVTGEVHVRPGMLVMSRGERAYSLDRSGPPAPGDSFKVGDTLLVYTSRGEGAFKVRLAGSTGPMFELMLATPGTGCERNNACTGRMLVSPAATWWVNVRTADGVSGWTTDARHFTGRDRCAGPAPKPDGRFE